MYSITDFWEFLLGAVSQHPASAPASTTATPTKKAPGSKNKNDNAADDDDSSKIAVI